MNTRITTTNTRWRDGYGRRWAVALVVAAGAHATVFFFLPRGLTDRLHEAMIPDPTVLIVAGSPGPMESIAYRTPNDVPVETPPPLEEEEQVEPTPSETASETITVAEVTTAANPTVGSAVGVPEGTGESEPAGGGGGAVVPPRPIHLVVPQIPRGVDRRRARGERVHLLVEVLPDGTVGRVEVEKGSRIEALNVAALDAARDTRYLPASRDGIPVAHWTRTEMRF